jgi:hypothetical protein
MQLLLADGWVPSRDTRFRLAVETDDDGDVTEITLCQIEGDEFNPIVRATCSLPIDAPVTTLTTFEESAPAVDLPPPPVGDLPAPAASQMDSDAAPRAPKSAE